VPAQLNTERRREVVAHLSALHRALEVLIAVGDLEAAASMTHTLGDTWRSHCHYDEGIAYLSTILNSPGADELSDQRLVALYEQYGDLTRGQGHAEQAETYYRLALAKQLDDPRAVVRLQVKIGAGAYLRGQYDQALEQCATALELAQQLDMTEARADIHWMLGILTGAHGNTAECLERLVYAHALSEHYGALHRITSILNELGDTERARRNYRKAIDYYEAAALAQTEHPADEMVANGNLAFALLAVGDVSPAQALFASGYRYWEAGHAPFRSALCLTGLAGLQLSAHAYQQAARFLAVAKARFASSDWRLEPADKEEYERIEAQIQAHVSADELHSIAERVAREDGYGLTLGRVDRLGIAALMGGVAGLSSREREMLALAAQGLTDKQIAVRCSISLHTVNSHLRAVFRKLEVTSRSAAIHVGHQQGWL
jgi:DNA-binding CsgD family transcriptional regulator